MFYLINLIHKFYIFVVIGRRTGLQYEKNVEEIYVSVLIIFWSDGIILARNKNTVV